MAPFILRAALAAGTAIAAPPAAHAVIVLESTYDANGFASAAALAQEPQFRGVMDLYPYSAPARGSAVWIGNDEEYAYLLTAAHNFCDGSLTLDMIFFESLDGQAWNGKEVTYHPENDCGNFSRMGFDVAIVTLEKPLPESAVGEQPTLYDGDDEHRKTLTMVGYGIRGVADRGYVEPAPRKEPLAAEAEIGIVAIAPDDISSMGDRNAGNFLVPSCRRKTGQ